MTIHSGEAELEAPNTYELQLAARASENVADTRDHGSAEGYFLQEKSFCCDYEDWTCKRCYVHPGDALMLRDG